MGEDHISRFGLACSKDGINFKRLPYPVFFPNISYEIPHKKTLTFERERGGVENPRAIVVNNTVYILYTAFHKKCHIAIAKISINDFQKLF